MTAAQVTICDCGRMGVFEKAPVYEMCPPAINTAADAWASSLNPFEPVHRHRPGRWLLPSCLQAARTQPAPYRERAYARGPGFCCVCGQPVYRFGWHVDLWGAGANKSAVWHCACVVAGQFWNAPGGEAPLLRHLQVRRCGETGGRLRKNAEVDHHVPLFRVWSEYRDAPWPQLLDYGGLPNLQAINRDIHATKCAAEAHDRYAARHLAP